MSRSHSQQYMNRKDWQARLLNYHHDKTKLANETICGVMSVPTAGLISALGSRIQSYPAGLTRGISLRVAETRARPTVFA